MVFFKELFTAIMITVLGAVVALMLTFVVCANSEQCSDNTKEIYLNNGYAKYGLPYQE